MPHELWQDRGVAYSASLVSRYLLLTITGEVDRFGRNPLHATHGLASLKAGAGEPVFDESATLTVGLRTTNVGTMRRSHRRTDDD